MYRHVAWNEVATELAVSKAISLYSLHPYLYLQNGPYVTQIYPPIFYFESQLYGIGSHCFIVDFTC